MWLLIGRRSRNLLLNFRYFDDLKTLKIDKFLFGEYVISKNKGEVSEEIFTQFYEANKTEIKKLENLFSESFAQIREELTLINSKKIDFNRARIEFSKFFDDVNIEDHVGLFLDLTKWSNTKELINTIREDKINHKQHLTLKGERTFDELTPKEIRKFFQKDFLEDYFNLKINSLKTPAQVRKFFVEAKSSREIPKKLFDIASQYIMELLSCFKTKKLKTVNQTVKVVLMAKIYIDTQI